MKSRRSQLSQFWTSTIFVAALRELLKSSVFVPALALALPAFSATVEYTYDANGRLRGVYAPNGEAAQYVYDPAGNITQILRFPSTQLALVEFTPTSGPVGTQVVIYGTGFSATASANSVAFNGTFATVTAATASKLTTNVPVGAATGPISVTVGGATANGTSSFVVTAGSSAPTITGFSPTIGTAGTAVTVSGSNFDATPSLNNITFNSTFAIANAATTTSLTTTVPAYAGSGPIRVRTKNGTATSSIDFLVPFGTIAAADIVASYRAVIDGASASYSIPANGKVVYVLFDGVQGQGVGVGITTNGCLSVTVERPDNTDLRAGTSLCSSTSLDLPILPLTGTYVLAIKSAATSPVSGIVTVSSDSTGTLGAEGSVSTFSTSRAGQNGRYRFNGTAGQTTTFYVYGLPSAVQPSRVDIIHPNGQVIATTNSGAASAYLQTVAFDFTGTYSILVSPQGLGSGSWSIQYGKPDLTIQSFTLGSIAATSSGAFTVPVTAVIKNQGTVGAKAGVGWYDEAYLSTDSMLDTTDPRLGYLNPTVDVPAGGTYTVNFTAQAATTTPNGSYTVFFKTDGWDSGGNYSSAFDRLKESNESNNVASAPVTFPGRPDLVASNISIGTVTVNRTGSYSFPVTYSVTNAGPLAAPSPWYDYAYISTDGLLDTSDVSLGYLQHASSLASGTSYTVTINAQTTTTIPPGTYTLFGKTDGYDASGKYATTSILAEGDETNNTLSASVTLPGRPDLTASNLSMGAITVNQNGSYTFPMAFTVTNIGPSTAIASWYDECYLSNDGTLDTSDISLGNVLHSVNLAPGASYAANLTCTTRTTTAAGAYTLFIKTDGYDSGSNYSATSSLAEADESNNTLSQTITLPVKPDLTVANLSAGTITVNTDGSYSIPVTFEVPNAGGSTAKASWYNECYLSSDGVLDTTDAAIGYFLRNTDLAAGAQFTVSLTCRTPTTTPAGTYTLFVKADGYDSNGKYATNSLLSESDETNNTASLSITLPNKP